MTNLGSETFPLDLPTRASVWDLASDEVKSTLEGHTQLVSSVAISPIFSFSSDNTVR